MKQIPPTISTKSQQKTCIQMFLKDLSMNFPYFPYLLRCYIFKGKIVLSKGKSRAEVNRKLSSLGKRKNGKNNHLREPGWIKVQVSKSESFQNHDNFEFFIFINEKVSHCANQQQDFRRNNGKIVLIGHFLVIFTF